MQSKLVGKWVKNNHQFRYLITRKIIIFFNSDFFKKKLTTSQNFNEFLKSLGREIINAKSKFRKTLFQFKNN
jgi:hypothetical protein